LTPVNRVLTRRQLLRLGAASALGATALVPVLRPRSGSAGLLGGRLPAQGLDQPPGTRLVLPGLRGDGPLLAPVVSTGSVYQGGALRVAIPGATSASATLFDRVYPFTETPEGPTAYIGIGVADSPGEALLRIDAVDPVLGPQSLERPITILATDWTVDYIWLPPSSGEDDDGETDEEYAERVRQEQELIATTYALVTPRQWIEPWLVPLTARISGYFGEQRSFNGGPVAGHHGGTDFGIIAGTPIHSTNAGTVVVARNVPIRGNLVIVDHGTGILSGYAHMSAFEVAEGDHVEQGQVLGLVGSTGLSTGAHLHWELSVHGVLVDGLRWLDGSQGF
jgi:murein DD-endopeptidase MepM/ murein hydrolase activator NlpD